MSAGRVDLPSVAPPTPRKDGEGLVPRPHFVRPIARSTSSKSLGSAAERTIASPRSPRYPSLDIWRGVACLLVVVFHSMFYANSDNRVAPADQWSALLAFTERLWLGVPIFFVISGYCIAATVDSRRRGAASWKSYFVRRIRRIVPPYWCALALTLVAVLIVDLGFKTTLFTDNISGFPSPNSIDLWQWCGNATLTESWRYLFVGGHPSYFLGHAWTLFYEEQFYVVSGLLLVLSPRRFFFATALVTAATLFARHAGPWLGAPLQGTFLDGHWLMFAAGILVYYHINYATSLGRRAGEAILLCAMAYAARDLSGLPGLPNTFDNNALIAFGFALLLLALRRWDQPIMATPATLPLQFCGTICYSLYLVHWPICKAVSHACHAAGVRGASASLYCVMPLCMFASLAAGYVFHRTVERRFLNPPRRDINVTPLDGPGRGSAKGD